jgi:DNA-binding transcriptional LysR family regulator
MTTQVRDWHLFRAFLAVVREGSLSSAARALGTTQPTMGRQVAALEASLGVKLFTRSLEGLAPTEAG